MKYNSVEKENQHRKKKKILAIKDVRVDRYSPNLFIERKSLLDQYLTDSSISQSPFKGILRAIMILTGIYVINNITLRIIKDDVLLALQRLHPARGQIEIGLAFWALVHFWTYLSFINQKLIIWGIPFSIVQIAELAEEMVLFFGFPYLVYHSHNFYLSTRMYMYFQICIHYFKMNSYYKMNRDYREQYLKGGKQSSKEGTVLKYPNNINFKDFLLYLLHPTFSYQDEYPIKHEFNLKMFIFRLVVLLFGIYVMWQVYEDQLIPLLQLFYDGISVYEIFPCFYLPTLVIYFVGFFVIFEFACNCYADISGFADRQFYQDYWNCTNFDQYARKWNKLVHEFLYRHFYLEYLIRWKMTPFQANLWTFIFSVIFHEVFLTLIFKRVSFYLTSLQINQLLLLFAFTFLKGSMLANMLFWFGQFFAITGVCFNYSYDYMNFEYAPNGVYEF